MANRLVYWLLFAFWLVMNGLLLRSELSGKKDFGSRMPVELVLQKILTAPDSSTLEIGYRNKKAGYCRWTPTIVEEKVAVSGTADEPLEGMVQKVIGYTIDVDGNAGIYQTNRCRFQFHAELGANKNWKSLSFRLNDRPLVVAIDADASRQELAFKVDNTDLHWEQTLSFTDLQSPDKILHNLGLPLNLGLALPGLRELSTNQLTAASVQWQARSDWMRIGHSELKVYRLEGKWLDRFRFTAYISRVGEILRVELSDDIFMVNDAVFIW